MSAKPFLLCAFTALSAACSTSVEGAGDPSSSLDGGSASNDVPADIEALFDAPTTDATPDSLFGVWARTGNTTLNGFGSEWRARVAEDSITLAQKELRKGQIVYVTAAARVTAGKITIVESKSAAFGGDAYAFGSVTLTISEVARCAGEDEEDISHGCFRVDGTRLLNAFGGSWLKLSDLPE